MKAIILAAGVGSRIRPLTYNTPKSLLKIGGKTILQRMIDNLLSANIDQVAIVIGYLEDAIKEFVAKTYPDLNVTFIRNELYDQTNTAYSLNLTRSFVGNDDFIKFDADVVFEKAILEKLVANQNPNCLCIDRNINLAAEEVKVVMDERGKVLRVGKKIDPALAKGESIGIEKISKEAGKVLFEELERLMKEDINYLRYYDDSYTTLVERGIPFFGLDITGLDWVEIDTHKDLELAIKLFS